MTHAFACNSEHKSELRSFVKSVKNSLQSDSTEPVTVSDDKILKNLHSINRILLCEKWSKTENLIFSKIEPQKLKKLFLSECYSELGYFLLHKLDVDWVAKLSQQTEALFKSYFLCGSRYQSLNIICDCIIDSRAGIRLSKCVSLLEEFLIQHKILDLFCELCQLRSKSEVEMPDIDQYTSDSMVNIIASLPDKMANKLQKQNSEVFYPKSYIPLITADIYGALTVAYDMVKRSEDCRLEFISRLIGKLCLSGYGELLWSSFLPRLLLHIRHDFIWCRICERIITGVQDRCLESVFIPLFAQLPWYGLIDKILGDCVLHREKVRYLLCTKLLLLRCSEQVCLLQNIIGYLASSHTRRHLFIQVMKELLRVWGDSSAVKHRSYEQHMYLTRAIFVCLGFVDTRDKITQRNDCLELLMVGIQCHIASSDPHRRCTSMALAEAVSSVFDSGGSKLKFEYEQDDEVKNLLLLMEVPKDSGLTDTEKNRHEVCGKDIDRDKKNDTDRCNRESQLHKNNGKTSDGGHETASDDSLDSDDDLLPYDMSNDVQTRKIKSPKYIRECMEGLISSDNYEKIEVCLAAAEPLIRSSPDGLSEIADEFTKILIHLNDTHSIEGFLTQRFGALVSLAVKCPTQVSHYLAEEFYNRNYNIRQRLDMLEVLAAAARELSTPEPTKTVRNIQELPTEQSSTQNSTESSENWQDIIQKRIESKTRRFAKGRHNPEPVAVANKFIPVAGQFFYPLMKNFDRKENTLNLLGEDSLVLGKLIHTLGIVMYAATNSIACRQMAKTLMEFIWALRYHGDLGVRRAVLFAVVMVYLSVPPFSLLEDLQDEVLESKIWIEDVAEKDPDAECRKLAVQSLILLDNIIKQQFHKEEDR